MGLISDELININELYEVVIKINDYALIGSLLGMTRRQFYKWFHRVVGT